MSALPVKRRHHPAIRTMNEVGTPGEGTGLQEGDFAENAGRVPSPGGGGQGHCENC